jgi:mono/diheme cytochrome c family protein
LPPALLPTYNSIREQILAPRCIRCHSTGGRAEKIPLVTLSDLLNSPSDLVVPGSPEESSLVISITRTDRKRMPPPSSGTALPPEQIQAVETWIKNGAKD